MTALKKIFEEVRATREIELILPYFLPLTFYAIGAGDSDGNFDFALSKSPSGNGFCITVSDDIDKVTFDQWSTMALNGRQLLDRMPENAGVLIAYSDGGGDFITQQQVEFLLNLA